MSLKVKKITLAGSLYVKLANVRRPIETLLVENSTIYWMKAIFPENQRNLKTLILTECSIKKIRVNTFQQLRQLQYLDLSFNSIESLDESLFVENLELENIFLNNNRLNKIVDKLFDRNANLKAINLGGNFLQSFNNQNLLQLHYLNLKNNILMEFKNNTFPNLITLILNLNKLHTASFEGNSMPELIVLELMHNAIVHFSGDFLRNLTKIQDLYLNSNKLQVIQNDSFSSCPNLIKLNLSKNQLCEIHDRAFANLVNLKNLNLGHNYLKSIDLKMFELDSTRNSSIEELWIDSNKSILTLSPNFFEKFQHLEYLILRKSNIYFIEDGTFSQLKMLRVLDLSANNLNALPSECLPIETEIQQFNVSWNEIKVLDDDFFADGTILDSLDLSGNVNLFISENAFVKIANSLKTLRLKSISFKHHLIPNLSCLKNLQIIEFDSNQTGAFPNFAFSELTAVVRLIFTRNFDSEQQTLNLLEYPIISDRNLLVHLNLQHCGIRSISSNVFQNLLLLEVLNLSQNYLCYLKEDLFANNKLLSVINLDHNRLRNFECNHFKFNNQLTRLFLANSSMTWLDKNHLNLNSLQFLSLAKTCNYSDTIRGLKQLKIIRV